MYSNEYMGYMFYRVCLLGAWDKKNDPPKKKGVVSKRGVEKINNPKLLCMNKNVNGSD